MSQSSSPGSPYAGNQYQQDAGAPGTPTGPKITSILKDFTAEALEELAFWLEQRGLHIPVNQLLGYSQIAPKVADDVVTEQTTVSTSYTDLATVGPTLSGLSDGTYLFITGASVGVTNGLTAATMAISFNGSVDGNSALKSPDTSGNTISRLYYKSLSNAGNNTAKVQYRCESGNGTTDTASFGARYLYALRVGNV